MRYVPTMEALQAGHLTAGRIPRQDGRLRSVEVGKVADLVLLDADPLESISHTRKIRAVILGGKYLDVVKMREAIAQPRR